MSIKSKIQAKWLPDQRTTPSLSEAPDITFDAIAGKTIYEYAYDPVPGLSAIWAVSSEHPLVAVRDGTRTVIRADGAQKGPAAGWAAFGFSEPPPSVTLHLGWPPGSDLQPYYVTHTAGSGNASDIEEVLKPMANGETSFVIRRADGRNIEWLFVRITDVGYVLGLSTGS